MNKKLMEYFEVYLENGRIQGECTLQGDFKNGNKAVKKLDLIFNIAKDSTDRRDFYLKILKESQDANTLTWCSIQMLKLGIEPKIAIETLEEIVGDVKTPQIFRRNAKLTLKEWDRGNIKRFR